jgi:hypothetical protein
MGEMIVAALLSIAPIPIILYSAQQLRYVAPLGTHIIVMGIVMSKDQVVVPSMIPDVLNK